MNQCEDSLTSSESSSLMWECITDSSAERSESMKRVIIDSLQPFKNQSPKTIPSQDQHPATRLAPRSEHQLRAGYYDRLKRNGLLPQKPKKKLHHLIVFDWDDTLFCTSFMNNLLQ